MAMNRIQFQAGLSLPSFLEQYGTEAQCEAALELARWHQGFRCPACGEADHYVLNGKTHKSFQCKGCRLQTSLITGTLFHSTLKTSLGGSYHAFNFAKYGTRYLSGFVYRFNRRFHLDTLPMHLRVPPLPVNHVLQLGFAKLKNLANQVGKNTG